jgi:iron complex outermembrane receptor protein
LGVNYNPVADTFLYVSAATGYQSGGFISRAAAPFDLTYAPENLTNYDMGWKTQLFDRRLRINVDAYFMKYRDYQATSSFQQPNGTQAAITVNAGSADIKGVEFESTYLLTGYDEIGLDATLLRAKFTSFNLPNGDGYGLVAGRFPTDYTGNELPYAPHVTARLNYKHTFPLSATDSLVARVDSSYASHQFLDYHDYLAASQDAYSRSGASLTWERRAGDWTLSTRLFVRNIENKAVLVGGQGDSAAPNRDFNNFAKNGYYMPPRTVGIEFSGTLR